MNKYKKFFDEFKSFKINQDKQKQRGFNNYNILTSVLNKSDEVRLHSRMLYSLLNPHGEHYQETLFLDKFLSTLNVDEFNIQSKECQIYKEYRHIDLYITDGRKHIILENKVYAGDQKNQIKRYIDTIKKENKELDYKDVLVVYLSLDKKQPSSDSLGSYEIREEVIFKKNEELALFKSIHYKKEILSWLKECKFEVQNITNLNEVLIQYIDVVKMINNMYKDKIMSLEEYILKNKEFFDIALEIENTLPDVRKIFMERFFDEVKNTLIEELGDEWKVEIKGDLHTRYSFPFRIYKQDWINKKKNNLIIGFEFALNDYYGGYVGIVKHTDNVDIKNDILIKFDEELNNLNYKLRTTKWWLHYEFVPKGNEDNNFANLAHSNDSFKEEFIVGLLNIVNKFEIETNFLTKVNSYLNEKL